MKNIPMDIRAIDKDKINIANYHTHTKRCMHAQGEDREYVEAAIESGYKILGFSDHSPQISDDGYLSGMRMSPMEFEGYVDSITALAKEYKNDIKIYLGLETEYFPAMFERLLKLIEPYPVDYMIMGQHWLYNQVPETVATKKRTDEQYLKEYVDQIIEGMKTGYFTYLAHPDVANFVGDVSIYKKHMLRLASTLKEMNIPMEINALGYADNRFYPNKYFLEAVKELEADFVIGVDAHNPEMLRDEARRRGCMELAEKYGLKVINKVI
ncbi:MAG: histidinol-phosphatase [Lachnospiraceae bacterium]|nr:histidinol-phosphatase [Lachnospiraceae bacterium]